MADYADQHGPQEERCVNCRFPGPWSPAEVSFRSHMLQQGAVCCHALQHTAEGLSFTPVLELSRPSTDSVLPCVAVRISVHFCCVLQPAELEALLTRALKSALQSGSLCNGVVIDGLGCSYADAATAAASLMSGFGLEKKRE